MIIYVLIGCIVFLFIMFLGQNTRIGTLEVCLAALVEHHTIQLPFNEKTLEFQKEVLAYHKKLDTYGRALDERVAYVENTIVAKQ